MHEWRIPITFRIVNELFEPIIWETAFIDRFIQSIHPAEKKLFPHESPLVPILMLHWACKEAKKNESDICQEEKYFHC